MGKEQETYVIISTRKILKKEIKCVKGKSPDLLASYEETLTKFGVRVRQTFLKK